jgi:hypothetical protein
MQASGALQPKGWVNVLDDHGDFRTLADIRREVIARALKAYHPDVEAVCCGLAIDRHTLDGWRLLH